jgi:hypothetical protein
VFLVRHELNSAFCPHSVFVCSIWFSQQTAIISLNSINRLGSVAETVCGYNRLRTHFKAPHYVFFQALVRFSFPGLNILLSAPFSDTLSLCFPLGHKFCLLCTGTKEAVHFTAAKTEITHILGAGIATGYGLDDQCSIRRNATFSLLHSVQTGSVANSVSYAMGSVGSFLAGKATGAWILPLTSI